MSNYVYDNNVFIALKHHLSWISDKDVNDKMYTYYKLYALAIPRVDLTAEQLQLKCDLIAERYNKLYETTQYKYDPIANVEATETRTITSNRGNSSETHNSQYPMNSINAREVLTSSGKGAENEKTVDEFVRHGNIGVTTTQKLIEAERRVTLDLLADYIAEFGDYFIIDTWRGDD